MPVTDFIDAVYVAFGNIIEAVWPECATQETGIFEADHAENLAWNRLTPPYAVIAIDSTMKAPGYGEGNQVYNPTVSIFYVCETDGPVSPIRSKLTAMEQYLTTPANNALVVDGNYIGQITDVLRMTWSASLPANQVFIAKQSNYRTGRLDVQILYGYVMGS